MKFAILSSLLLISCGALLGCSGTDSGNGDPAAPNGTDGTNLPGPGGPGTGPTPTLGPDGNPLPPAPNGTPTPNGPQDSMGNPIGPDGNPIPAGPGPAPSDGPSGGPSPNPTEPGAATPIWINPAGRVDAERNSFGIQGHWYAYADGVTSQQSGNPYTDGKYCVTGEANGDSANWGAGIGLDLNGISEKLPYQYQGKLTGFRIRFTGEAPAPPRLNFVVDPDLGVNPFIPVTLGETVVYSVADAQVPFSWGVDNAGQRVGDVLYSVQLLAPGDSEVGPIALCIEDFEPIFDENAGPGGTVGSTYINSDGFVAGDSNTYGIQGPVYVISDGRSTDQSGVPYRDGKYCVSGTFSGSSDDWGAGIAFDMNKPPGDQKAPLTYPGDVAAFQIGLSGTTPGRARIQFVINEPQDGNQPFLLGLMNSTASYPINWAQVPTSWDVSDSGLGVTNSVYTLQLYLEGDVAGPFDVCIEEFAPLGAAEVSYAAAAAASGYSGFRTLDDSDLAGEYERWKSRHFRDCGDGTACVPRDEGDCISEGVAYGMLLGVGYDDRDAFDKLWAYFQKHMNGNGVMRWQTNACGSATSTGSATDGELDAAMALIQAGCKWGGSYANHARTLIDAIATHEVDRSCGALKPGDNFGGCSETNPSYVAPAYYKVFQALTGDTIWTTLTNNGYQLLTGNQSRKGGLFSDWSNSSGGVSAGDHRDDYGPDASRVPWRVATDYVWHGEQRAIPILDTFAAYLEQNGGVARNFTPNSNYRGGSALSAIHKDAATAHRYTDAWLMTSVDDESYFPGTLRPIYMLLAGNKFSKGCD